MARPIGLLSRRVRNRPHHLLLMFVFPLPLIRDRPQKPGLCPSQVCHLHDHLRSDPMHAGQLKG